MAGEIVTKKITELEENTTIDDADILMAGDKGTNALKRFTIGAFLTAIKAKLAAWTFDTLQTTSKTLPGAVNELNSKTIVETHEATNFNPNIISKYLKIKAGYGMVHMSGFLQLNTRLYNDGEIMFKLPERICPGAVEYFYSYNTLNAFRISENGNVGVNGSLNIVDGENYIFINMSYFIGD